MKLLSLFTFESTFALLATFLQAEAFRTCGQRHDNFLDPPAVQRPRFRYWLPDGSVEPDVVKSDIRAAGDIGAGGVEFLPFYNYGGGLGPPPAGVNWSAYGFGTPPHLRLLTAALEAHNESGLAMDFSLGPNQGQGVPAEPDTEGLQWDLFAQTLSITAGGRLTGTIPVWGTGELVAAVSSLVISRANVSYNLSGVQGPTTVRYQDLVLDSESLEDITSSVSDRGELSAESSDHAASSGRQLFFCYQKLSGDKNLHFDSNRTESIWDRGSYTVDHFSSKGADTICDFWERYMFVDGVQDLLARVGNYGWEDSLEIRSTISWTPGLPDRFERMFGYDLRKYLPLVMFGNNNINLQNTEPGSTRCVLNTPDGGQGYVNDYHAALAEGYQ
ncbi:hypothetical protein CMUS01_07286 [Colletotrichum musicola]|uniref:Berberine/berberine-like domain-containing protein n=1 Tax=Colletotrichum musicola TaxID=2175873 RepID=A0A8H6KHP9_9PEZI|nr:hypothetical protein CMUS01_07286 [Colletotrichum musicola]